MSFTDHKVTPHKVTPHKATPADVDPPLTLASTTLEPAPPVDRAWRVWEWLHRYDQQFGLFVDIVLTAGMFLVSSGWVVYGRPERGQLAYIALLTLPLIARRRAPMAVFTFLSVVAFVQWNSTHALLADASLLIALYSVAVLSSWTMVTAAWLILEVGVVLATVRWGVAGSNLKSVVFLTGMSCAALSAGVVVRALRSQRGWLAERARRLELERDQQAAIAAADERARIARELHDVVSHNIQVMVTLADAAAVAQTSDPVRSAEALGEVSSTGRHALSDMRRLLGVLREERPEIEPGRPTAPAALAPQPGLGDLDALVERVRATGLGVHLEWSGQSFALSDSGGLTVYRIVQEALTNVLKHADSPTEVHVSVTFAAPSVTLSVRNDGGVAAPSTGRSGGQGVPGMTERAQAFRGTVSAGPAQDGGWQVLAVLGNCATSPA
jgi:signal transduction histidine kinase